MSLFLSPPPNRSPLSPPPPFSMRIVTIDHYMARPLPQLVLPHPHLFSTRSLISPLFQQDCVFAPLHGKAIQQVPVTRLFGVTPGGQKACMHVHRVFPYLLVPVAAADVGGGLDLCGNK